MTPPQPFPEYRDTPLWRTLAAAIEELETTREIKVDTAADYVVGYLCQQLHASRALAPEALRDEP
jgi:hypothetical protein